MGVRTMCFKCAREWVYTGTKKRATCPYCKTKASIESKRRFYVGINMKLHRQSLLEACKTDANTVILDCIGNKVYNISVVENEELVE